MYRVLVTDGYNTDTCNYFSQLIRILNYQDIHTPESVVPYTLADFPEGCNTCGSRAMWEYRELPSGRHQSRCTGCHFVITDVSYHLVRELRNIYYKRCSWDEGHNYYSCVFCNQPFPKNEIRLHTAEIHFAFVNTE